MEIQSVQRRWFAPLVLVIGLGLVLTFTAMFGGASANAQGAHDFSDLKHHDRFTGPGDETAWPPRPVGANSDTERVIDPPSGDSAGMLSTSTVFASAPELSAALGDDWIQISESPSRTTKNGFTGAEYTYFSRANNQTVMVIEDETGQFDVTTWDSKLMQPVVSRGERNEAAALGRDWLINNGFPEAADLEGFSIRALNDGEFYDVRMVYVTFATGSFADPTHSALVDMTNLTAVSGRAL